MFHYVHSSLKYNSQKLERTQMPFIREWIERIQYIYTMEYYSAIKNDEFMKFFGKWMEPG
jgi:predicted DNA-binding protein